MLIALEPTRIPRTMKIVAGFQALDLGCAGSEASRRRNALGTSERHSEGFATRGRCDVPSCKRLEVAKVLRGVLVDCRAHCEQMLSVCLKALEGAMMYVCVSQSQSQLFRSRGS
jgi:hypothetical protein